MNRRQFLSAAALTAGALVLEHPAISWALEIPRSLSFYHTHTGEKLDITYGGPENYDWKALREVNHFLRDFRTGEVHRIDPQLLDILAAIRETFGGQGTFDVISGYRSPKTNQQLRSQSTKVAKRSLHMEGKAIDIRMPGIETKKIQQCAIYMQRGGVGFYGKSDFVHLDTGWVRAW